MCEDAPSRSQGRWLLRNHGRFTMRRFVISLSIIVVLLFGLVAAMGGGATAQEATPDTTAMMSMVTHPLVGAGNGATTRVTRWPVHLTAIFHDDGTYTEYDPNPRGWHWRLASHGGVHGRPDHRVSGHRSVAGGSCAWLGLVLDDDRGRCRGECDEEQTAIWRRAPRTGPSWRSSRTPGSAPD